ncbi:MAG TPA: hypothetical protein VN364_13545 [Bellilinea sp.]|nr:hypothetical protein [Bellilinea sp.]
MDFACCRQAKAYARKRIIPVKVVFYDAPFALEEQRIQVFLPLADKYKG